MTRPSVTHLESGLAAAIEKVAEGVGERVVSLVGFAGVGRVGVVDEAFGAAAGYTAEVGGEGGAGGCAPDGNRDSIAKGGSGEIADRARGCAGGEHAHKLTSDACGSGRA